MAVGTVLSAAALWLVLLPAIGESPTSVPSCTVAAVQGGTTITCEDGATLTTVVSKSES